MKSKKSFFASCFAAAGILWTAQAGAVEMVITSEIPNATNPSPYIAQFITEVAKRTNDEVQGKYFPAAQLYNDREGLAAIGTGSVHMVWPVSSRLESIDVRTGIISLPFTMSEKEMTNKCFAEGFRKQISGYLEPKGMEILGFLRTADLIYIMRNTDVKSINELKGKKIRIVGGQLMLDAMRSIDASPISMSASEMSAALSQGAIDGVMTSPAGWVDVLGNTAKFGTYVPGMALATSAVVVDKAWLDGLPAAHRKVIQEVLDEIIERQWKETVTKDQQLIKQMVDQGGTYRTMEPAEVKQIEERFVAANAPFLKKHVEVVRNVEGLKKECLSDAS
ncbi:TRAP transporter substrate-binding protein DctP [Pollutimonas bauzanensis]|uniref:TRAP transporter substrate-binding protein DctP n=1 Tax=Pollutimonas bauzanensis TaxID=658167 RepID=UPI0033423421